MDQTHLEVQDREGSGDLNSKVIQRWFWRSVTRRRSVTKMDALHLLFSQVHLKRRIAEDIFPSATAVLKWTPGHAAPDRFEAVAHNAACETHLKQAHRKFLAKHLFISTEMQMLILPAA